MAATVTIDNSYFQTLLRRASCQPDDPSSIVISKARHDALMRISSEYDNLRACLLQGGIAPQTLDFLAQSPPGAQPTPGADFEQSKPAADWRKQPVSPPPSTIGFPLAGYLPGGIFRANASDPHHNRREPTLSHHNATYDSRPGQQHWPVYTRHDSPVDIVPVEDETDSQPWIQHISHAKSTKERHTVLLSNLPKDVGLKDITSAVRGGRLIEVWLNRKDSSATVTFVSGAADFVSYARRKSIIIKTKLVEVSWSERQFEIAPHLVAKLSNGVSRNFVIKGAAGRLNEQRIREDMEHIQNLVIIAIMEQGNDIYVSTNSVNNAMFAKTCMSSRKDYKKLRIDWYPDECAEALPAVSDSERPITRVPVIKAPPSTNMYDILGNGEDGSVKSEKAAGAETDSNSEDCASCCSGASGVLLHGRTGDDSEPLRGSSTASS